jgi:protein-disulfide isomerase
MREIWFATVTLMTVAAALPTLAQNAPAPSTPPSAAALANPLALTPDDRILGKPDAPITIVEYGSLTCPHCAHFATEVLPKLQPKWIDSGKAKLVLRIFPLNEPDLRAAMITRCLPRDKYYAFADTLFASQQQWVVAKDYQAELAKLALLAGMNKTQFNACLSDKTAEDQVLQARLVASQQLQVNSTPTFFINGTKFDGAPEEDAFDAALSKAAGS